jgi:hypothetical protein
MENLRIIKGNIIMFDHQGKEASDDRLLDVTSLLSVQFSDANEKIDKNVILDAIEFKQNNLKLDAIYLSRYMDIYIEHGKPKEMENELLHKEPDITIEKERASALKQEKKKTLFFKWPLFKKKEKETKEPEKLPEIDEDFISNYERATNIKDKVELCINKLESLFSNMFENKEELAGSLFQKYRHKLTTYSDKFYSPSFNKDEKPENIDNYLEEFKKLLQTPIVDNDLITSIAGTGHCFYLIEKQKHVTAISDDMSFVNVSGYNVNFTPIIGVNTTRMIDLGMDTILSPEPRIKKPKELAEVINEEMVHKFAAMGNLDSDPRYINNVAMEFAANQGKIIDFFDRVKGPDNNKFRNSFYNSADLAPEMRPELYTIFKHGSESEKNEARELMPFTSAHVEVFVKAVSDFAKKIRGESVEADILPGSKINLLAGAAPTQAKRSHDFCRGGV